MLRLNVRKKNLEYFLSTMCHSRNAEDIRLEEEEANKNKANNVMPTYNEFNAAAAGQLLEDDDHLSACSCTCLGGASCANHELLIDQGYQPADIYDDDLSVHRASV